MIFSSDIFLSFISISIIFTSYYRKICYNEWAWWKQLQVEEYTELEMLLIPNALCWSSQKCNCAARYPQKCNCGCALPTEVQLRLCLTCRSWQKLFAGKNFVKILVTAPTQLHSYSEQQRVFGNSNICNWLTAHNWQKWKSRFLTCLCCKIYRVEAVSLKNSNYTLKIMIFVNMWNLGQFCENLIFCQ